MGWATLDVPSHNIHFQISREGLPSITGTGLLKTGGNIVEDGRVPALQGGQVAEVEWWIASSEGLRLPSAVSRSAFFSEFSGIFPGFTEWLDVRECGCAALCVNEDALTITSAPSRQPSDLRAMAAVLVVLPELQWGRLEKWLRGKNGESHRLVVTFDLFGLPTSALRERLADTWESLAKSFDPITKYMCEFAESPLIQVINTCAVVLSGGEHT